MRASDSNFDEEFLEDAVDLDGLRVTATWFSPVVRDGVRELREGDGPDLGDDLAGARAGAAAWFTLRRPAARPLVAM